MGMMCVLHQQGITPKRHVLPGVTQRNSDLVISTRKCMEFYVGDLDWIFCDIRKSMEHPSFFMSDRNIIFPHIPTPVIV